MHIACVSLDTVNPRIAQSYRQYLEAVKTFDQLYQVYCEAHSDVISVDNESIRLAYEQAITKGDISQSADAFGTVISNTLEKIEGKKKADKPIARKVGQTVSKIFPLMRLTFAILQGSTEVSITSNLR